MSVNLNEIWTELTKDLNDNKNTWWNKITERLSAPERKYHNMDHLEGKYKLYLDIKHSLSNKEAMEYALFFSYFEYDPKSIDTDDRNIEHFKTFCNDSGVPLVSDLCKDVTGLLCLGSHITDEHKTEGVFGSEDKHYFLDLDMAVLGSGPEEYEDYSRKVKEEYAFLSSDMYTSLRIKVLQNFLQIPNIYSTKYFREKFEGQARSNIQEEINLLLSK